MMRYYVELAEVVKRALGASEAFKQLSLPRRVSTPLFSRYDEGMEYGLHTDDAYRSLEALRTDVSATLFLSEPDSYAGGELVVEDAALKLPAGHLVLYPSTSIHRVAKVTRGTRLAAVFWVQSLVRNEEQRDILVTLARVLTRLETPALSLALARVQQNLLRMWVEG